jgi:hypothetical protein
MSTAKHTPGPWTLLLPQPAEDEEGHPTGAFYYPGGIEGADGNPVCEFGTLAGSGTMFENEADHLLIAAAPELLAALKSLSQEFVWLEDQPRGGYADTHPIIAARDAIAKAESAT